MAEIDVPDSSIPAEFLFTLTAKTAAGISIPGGPQGARIVVPVTGGSFEGPRLAGIVEPAPGGDWITGRADGSFKLDVRIVLTTHDGAHIVMTYTGIGVRTPGGLQLRTAPLFETGDERYAWLNAVQAVGIGSSAPGSVTYQVYALTV